MCVLAALFKRLWRQEGHALFPADRHRPHHHLHRYDPGQLAPSTTAPGNWWIAIWWRIVVVIVCNIWGKGMIKIIPILLGVLVILCSRGRDRIRWTSPLVKEAAVDWACRLPGARHRLQHLVGNAGHGPACLPRSSPLMPIALATIDGAHRRYVRHLLHRGKKLHRRIRACTALCWATAWLPLWLPSSARRPIPRMAKTPAFWL